MAIDTTDNKRLIILITGSSGCLGQHIIRLLNENDDDDNDIGEIRCFDLKPYSNNLKHKITKEMTIITGDIRNEKQLADSLKNVNLIIHCAAMIDLSVDDPAKQREMESINVDGTRKLLEMAIENNVEHFVHISGTEVNIGYDPIYYSSENTIIIPKRHLLSQYSKTKFDAEEIVREFTGKLLANGSKRLRTCILRPNIMYGEEDNHFVTKILTLTRLNGGYLRRLDNVFIRMQPVYAGNVAWSCLRALKQLRVDPRISGEEFIITDDTRIMDPFEFVEIFLNECGLRLTRRSYPYWLFIMLFRLYYLLYQKFGYILSRIYFDLPDFCTTETLHYICNTYFFNRTKSTLRLDYDPLYDHNESIRRSVEYYKRL